MTVTASPANSKAGWLWLEVGLDGRGFCGNGQGMRKRIIDWLEKMSVASLAVGLYQKNALAIFVGILATYFWRDLIRRYEP